MTASGPAVVPPTSLQIYLHPMSPICAEGQTRTGEEVDSTRPTDALTHTNNKGTGDQATHSGAESNSISNTANPVPHTPENIVVDVYTLDESGKPKKTDTSSPFQTVACLRGPKGECVRFLAMVDNGAMINAIDSEAHSRIAKRLSPLQPSSRMLCMVDGSLVPSSGLWAGTFKWGPARVETNFEVFPSGGSWQMLIGKPLLEQTHAVQEYESDTILLPVQDRHVCIENYKPPWTVSPIFVPSTLFSPGRVQDNAPSNPSACSLPKDTIHSYDTNRLETRMTAVVAEKDENTNMNLQIHLPLGYSVAHSFANFDRTSCLAVTHVGAGERRETESQEGPEELTDMMDGYSGIEEREVEKLFTRLTEEGPFHPPRVKKIVELVQYGPLPNDKLQCLKDKVAEFVDTFTLSVHEVKPVDFIKFRLDIPKGTTFPLKVSQKPLTQAQKEYYLPLLDKFVEAGIL